MSIEPIDPDVDLHWERAQHPATPPLGSTLACIAAGGGVGALCRYQLSLAGADLGAGATWLGGVPVTTLAINVVGSALIGVLMVLAVERFPGVWWLRPLLGTGLLGGFTTFSAYAIDVDRLLAQRQVAQALAYLLATPVLAVLAVWLAASVTRAVAVRPAAGRAAR